MSGQDLRRVFFQRTAGKFPAGCGCSASRLRGRKPVGCGAFPARCGDVSRPLRRFLPARCGTGEPKGRRLPFQPAAEEVCFALWRQHCTMGEASACAIGCFSAAGWKMSMVSGSVNGGTGWLFSSRLREWWNRKRVAVPAGCGIAGPILRFSRVGNQGLNSAAGWKSMGRKRGKSRLWGSLFARERVRSRWNCWSSTRP